MTAPRSAVDELCRSYLDARWHFDPCAASAAGEVGHDHRLGAFDDAAVRAHLAALRSLAGAAEELEVDDPQEEIDRTALLDDMRVQLFRFQHERPHVRNPAFWLRHLFEGLQAVGTREPVAGASAGPLLERLRAMPAFLRAAEQTLHEPPQVLSDAALAMLGGGGELIVGLVQRLGAQAPDASAELAAAAGEALVALKGFGTGLTDRLTPAAEPTAFAVGEEQFNRRLHHEHALLAGAPELWRVGLHLRDELEAELGNLARRIDPSRPWRDLVEHLREQAPVDAPAVAAAYRAEVARARDFCAQHALVTLPGAPLEVVETPAWLRPLAPSSWYRAAPPSLPGQPARLFITEPAAGVGDAARARMLREHVVHAVPWHAAHDGIPGHHVRASALGEASLVRRHLRSPLTADGWAAYAEHEMAELGFAAGLEARLFHLVRRLEAAVLVDLDIGLHTRGMTAGEAVEELVRRVPIERRHAEAEVLRLCQAPTYGLCAAIGHRELLQVRELYRSRVGGSYAPRAFHDELLRHGALPPTLIRWGMGLEG